MPREKAFLWVLLSFASFGFLFGSLHQNSRFVRYRLSPEALSAESQVGGARIWQSEDLELIANVAADSQIHMQSARLDREGQLYVLDGVGQAIRRLAGGGEVLQTYRWGPPEEGVAFLAPLDFAVAESGEIFVSYKNQRLLHVFGPDGDLRRDLELPATPDRIALDTDGGFVAMALGQESWLFSSYSPDGEIRGRFGRLLAGDVQDAPVVDGWIAGDHAGAFVYAPFYVGLLASYTFDGRLRFVVETVGERASDPPRVLVGPHGGRRLEPGTPLSKLAVSVSEEWIFVLCEREAQAEHGRILDVYSNQDGRYLSSLRLPDRPRSAFVRGTKLYLIYPEKISVWRLPSEA